jgi:hypothetical protein
VRAYTTPRVTVPRSKGGYKLLCEKQIASGFILSNAYRRTDAPRNVTGQFSPLPSDCSPLPARMVGTMKPQRRGQKIHVIIHLPISPFSSRRQIKCLLDQLSGKCPFKITFG